MKSFDQFQNESFVGKAVGLMNKAATAAKGVAQKAANIKVAKPTTGPLVAPKKPTPGQIARSNPAAKAAALKKQAVQNKAAQQPKKTTTVATPVTKGPFTQTTKSGNKDMPGAIVKKTPSTGRKIGDFVKKAAGAVGSAASKVGSAASKVGGAVNKVRKDTRPARENIRTGVARVAGNRQVRQIGSALNQARKALPTAADYRTGQEGEGSGFGGSFSGRSVRGVKAAIDASKKGKKFERSSLSNAPVLGKPGLKNKTTVIRGRELDADGNPIEQKKDTSYVGKAKAIAKRAVGGAMMSTIKKDKPVPKKDDEPPEDKVTGSKVPNVPQPPSNSGAAKVTAGKGEERREAQSGGKSKGTGAKSIRTGTRYVERPKKEKPKKEIVTSGQKGKSEGDTDKIEVGASGRQKRITGGDDPVPVRFGKPGARRGRPPKKDEKSKPDKTSPGQLSLLDGESKVKTDSKKKQGEGLGSKVGDAVKTGAKKVATATGDAVKTGAKKVGKAVKDGAVKVGKGIKDEVVSGAKELSKDIEKKVAAGKEKRDAARQATKSKVTTNYTKPKPGEEMKVPEKKDKVTVSTSKDTTKEREKQKKQAPQALAQAVANRAEADAGKDAVRDMRQSGQKVTDDVRSQLNKTIAKTESDPNKSTQIKGKSDEELTRTTTSSDDEGSFRRGAKRTKKYSNNPKTQASWEKIEKRTPEEEEAAQQKMFGNKGAERATRKEIDKLRKKDTYNRKVKKKLNTNTNKKKEQTTESFSHWREEFIWETDKKYPEKIKEIKPMTGKNTITINPEDETSKYKRGY